jgi:hypothetical protein
MSEHSGLHAMAQVLERHTCRQLLALLKGFWATKRPPQAVFIMLLLCVCMSCYVGSCVNCCRWLFRNGVFLAVSAHLCLF